MRTRKQRSMRQSGKDGSFIFIEQQDFMLYNQSSIKPFIGALLSERQVTLKEVLIYTAYLVYSDDWL